MNYTHPNDLNREDSSQDWLSSALFFAKALGILLKENEGVVVDANGDLRNLVSGKKYVIFSSEGQIHIIEITEDLKEGQLVWMHPEGETLPEGCDSSEHEGSMFHSDVDDEGT